MLDDRDMLIAIIMRTDQLHDVYERKALQCLGRKNLSGRKQVMLPLTSAPASIQQAI